VTIVVKDQNAALDFYTKKMGFEKKADYTNPG
jgi:catechol 2,3-dioxygenase-like lactoylglutathione lyase family enzyme